MKEYKPGDIIRQDVEFTLVRPLEAWEKVKKRDGTEIEINNYRQNKWWAQLDDLQPLVIVCLDPNP